MGRKRDGSMELLVAVRSDLPVVDFSLHLRECCRDGVEVLLGATCRGELNNLALEPFARLQYLGQMLAADEQAREWL
jgi:hypothetical protein